MRTWKGGAYSANKKLNDNAWHHFAYSCATGQGQILYIDGLECTRNPFDHSDFDWAKLVCIGHSADIGNFIGEITDWRYYDCVLTESDIKQVMLNT